MSSVEQSTEIAADADELSMSRSASNSQSAVGIGTISGRAIMAVGELALRGIETMTIARTLQRITGRVRGSVQEAVTVRDVQDLLELQRVGLYPDSIRRKSWSLLHVLLSKGRSIPLIQVLLTWTSVEVQLFLRHLISYHLTGWSTIPTDNSGPSTSQCRHLVAESICYIIMAVLQKDPVIVHEIYDLYKFSRILTPPQTSTPSSDQKTRNSLTRFFDQWILQYAMDETGCRGSLEARCMIAYLKASSRAQVQVVVDHITAAILPFAYLPREDDEDPVSMMRKSVEEITRQYLNLGLSNIRLLHPTAPFLAFVSLLCEGTREASSLFLDTDFVDVILRLHSIRYYHLGEQLPATIAQMDSLCRSVLHMLHAEVALPSLSRLPSQYTYPSRSTSRTPSVYTSATVRKQSSSSSLSSLRAVFRLKMPPPPPPPSPRIPPAPPPSPSLTYYGLTSATTSEETLTTTGSSEDVLSVSDNDTMSCDTNSSEDSTSVLSFDGFDSGGTDHATVGIKTIASQMPSRSSTVYAPTRPSSPHLSSVVLPLTSLGLNMAVFDSIHADPVCIAMENIGIEGPLVDCFSDVARDGHEAFTASVSSLSSARDADILTSESYVWVDDRDWQTESSIRRRWRIARRLTSAVRAFRSK